VFTATDLTQAFSWLKMTSGYDVMLFGHRQWTSMFSQPILTHQLFVFESLSFTGYSISSIRISIKRLKVDVNKNIYIIAKYVTDTRN